MNFSRLSLLWKIWLSTSVALTILFLATGFYIHHTVQQAATRSLQDEARASSEAYDAMLEARAETLRSLAGVLSVQPERAVIERAGLEPSTFVLLTAPSGSPRTVLAGQPEFLPETDPIVESARKRFPSPSTGFYVSQGTLYQVAVTPVFDLGDPSRSLKSVLVAGHVLNHEFAQRLKRVAGNSEFILAARGQIYASTLDDRATGAAVRSLVLERRQGFATDGSREYVPMGRDLVAIDGTVVGRLFVLRSFEEAREHVANLRHRVLLMWAAAVIIGLALSYAAARRVVKPIHDLDEAASQVSRQNYSTRVRTDSDDELGRLAATFNRMCESLEGARHELIRRERLGAIARMASSIVHDLRNPLAAIHGGAEMLVETRPNAEQTRRIADNIHRASRRIQELLDDLTRVSRGGAVDKQPVRLADLVKAAAAAAESAAQHQKVRIRVEVPADLVIEADRRRLERVFQNLIQNAVDVMPTGGEVRLEAAAEGQWIMVEASDTGPGIAPAARGQLFQPFSSHGKKQGLGLGLALARQTVLDHGGDMWAAPEQRGGARFLIRLPKPASGAIRDAGPVAGSVRTP